MAFSTRPRNTWAKSEGSECQQSPRLVPVFRLGSLAAWTFTGLVFFFLHAGELQLETNSGIFHKMCSQRVNCAIRNSLPGWSFEFSELEHHVAPRQIKLKGKEGKLRVTGCLV